MRPSESMKEVLGVVPFDISVQHISVHSAVDTNAPMLSVHLPERLPARRTHAALHQCQHDLRKRELSCVEISRNDVSVVADGLRGIVQRSALQQIREKLVALDV